MDDARLFETPHPVCPHCFHAFDADDMNSGFSEDDLWALAPQEGRTSATCPQCDQVFWIQGSYKPTYTTAFAEEDL